MRRKWISSTCRYLADAFDDLLLKIDEIVALLLADRVLLEQLAIRR